MGDTIYKITEKQYKKILSLQANIREDVGYYGTIYKSESKLRDYINSTSFKVLGKVDLDINL